VPDKTKIKLTLLNADMKIIKELVNEVIDAGTYEVEFDASFLKQGTYFYRFEANGFSKTKEMILIK
jgi:hypothetical protein